MSKKKKSPLDYIVPIDINGLKGRMLAMPSPPKKKREILIIYGLHASLERMIGMAEDLNQYGGVTLPDLPGLGGMDSFYKIGEKPSLDNMADYLATFVKMRYRRKKVTIVGMSFGFVIVTRMLQKYPELRSKVNTVVSVVGFVHKDDFHFSRKKYLFFRYGASFFSNRLPALFMKKVALRPANIRFVYNRVADTHSKLHDADEAERKKRIDFEIVLWQCNDIRTYMDNVVSMLTLDLCKQRVDMPIYHVAVVPDRYFDNNVVEQHLNVIYKKVTVVESSMAGHAPTIVADAEEAAPFMPAKLRRILARSPV